MKKAFDDNVSRTKPRLRLGAFSAESLNGEGEGYPEGGVVDEAAPAESAEAPVQAPVESPSAARFAAAVKDAVVELERAEVHEPAPAPARAPEVAEASAGELVQEVKAR